MASDADAAADANLRADEAATAASQDVAEEIRRQIDLQIGAAKDLDTKILAVLSALGVFAGVVVPRVTIPSMDSSNAPGAAAALTVLVLGLFSMIRGISGLALGRGQFSYGADPNQMIELVDVKPHLQVLRGMNGALAEARARNEKALLDKHKHFRWEVYLFATAGVLTPLMAPWGYLGK